MFLSNIVVNVKLVLARMRNKDILDMLTPSNKDIARSSNALNKTAISFYCA